MRILLADDDEDICVVTGAVLELHGWQVDTVGSGAAALEAVRSTAYDVVVLDQSMPGGTGLEVAATLRGQGVATPMVLWTGWGAAVDRSAAQDRQMTVLDKADVDALVGLLAGVERQQRPDPA